MDTSLLVLRSASCTLHGYLEMSVETVRAAPMSLPCSRGTEMEVALKVREWSGLHTSCSLVQTPVSDYCFYCTQKSCGHEFMFNRSCIHSHTRELTSRPRSSTFNKYFSWINKSLKKSSLDLSRDRHDVSFKHKRLTGPKWGGDVTEEDSNAWIYKWDLYCRENADRIL